MPTTAIIETFSDLLVFSISQGKGNDFALQQSSLHCQWWLCKIGLSLLVTSFQTHILESEFQNPILIQNRRG